MIMQETRKSPGSRFNSSQPWFTDTQDWHLEARPRFWILGPGYTKPKLVGLGITLKAMIVGWLIRRCTLDRESQHPPCESTSRLHEDSRSKHYPV